MNESYILTVNYDSQLKVGVVNTNTQLTNVHEYFIMPSYHKEQDGTFVIDGYSYVHRTDVASVDVLEDMEHDD
jgi:hypothetical protein